MIERYCEKRLNSRTISSRTVIRERKLKRLSGLRNRSMKLKSQITSVVDNQNV